jgi:hypothetical protein
MPTTKKAVELKKTTEIVRYLLTEHPHTRNSDSFLYYKVLEYICTQKDTVLERMPIRYVLLWGNSFGFPCYETVRRARQKLQATYPELKACEEVEAVRSENEDVVRAYARSDV